MSRLAEIVFEFERTRRLGERAMAQLAPEHWHWAPDADANSIAILVQHMHGNSVEEIAVLLEHVSFRSFANNSRSGKYKHVIQFISRHKGNQHNDNGAGAPQ